MHNDCATDSFADSPIFTCANINFALSCILHALYPPPYHPTGAGGGPALGPSGIVQSTVGSGLSSGPPCGPGAQIKPHQHLSVSDLPRSGSVTQSERSFRITSDMVYRLGFLGLKIILVCYARHAYVNARRIVKTIGELGSKRQGGIHLWKFLDFIVTNRPALFVQLYPFIRFKVSFLGALFSKFERYWGSDGVYIGFNRYFKIIGFYGVVTERFR